MTVAIVDTGPLVALFDRAERHHAWVTERLEELDAPLLVCEPVLAEAMYLLARYPNAQDAVLELIQNGALTVTFRVGEHVDGLRKLLRKYRDMPMSLADACIVIMSEIHDRHFVLTLDSDFLVIENMAGLPCLSSALRHSSDPNRTLVSRFVKRHDRDRRRHHRRGP